MEDLFGADKISWTHVDKLQESAPNIIVWAAPVMFFFVFLEYVISYLQNRKYYERNETIGSIAVGVGNVLIGLLVKVVVITVIVWVYNIIPWRMELNWWTFLPCYILFDLCSYWAHYISHKQRYWRATQIAQHSGENYNLTLTFL
jgi:4-hydroxybenzoate polyprenyltransferase